MFVGDQTGVGGGERRDALLVQYVGGDHVLADGKVAVELGRPEPPLPWARGA